LVPHKVRNFSGPCLIIDYSGRLFSIFYWIQQ